MFYMYSQFFRVSNETPLTFCIKNNDNQWEVISAASLSYFDTKARIARGPQRGRAYTTYPIGPDERAITSCHASHARFLTKKNSRDAKLYYGCDVRYFRYDRGIKSLN